jgi:hypothetical protein
MAEDGDARANLLARIASRRASVRAHLQGNRPRVRRRANATIVLSSLAAFFTAGPAVGGETFAGGLQKTLGLSSDAYVWRVLCLAAMLVSVGAAVLTNLSKSHDAASRLSTAEAVDGELEGLAVLLEFGQLPVQDAVKLYQQYTAKISFVEDLTLADGYHPGPASAGVGAEPVDGQRRTGELPAVPPSPRQPADRLPPPPR